MFKLRKESNYDLLHWSLFIACAFTLTFKILEISSQKSYELISYNPELASLSFLAQIYS